MVYSLLPMEPIGSCAVVAQLDRALDSDSKGQRFESPRPHHKKAPCSVKSAAGCFFVCRHGPQESTTPVQQGRSGMRAEDIFQDLGIPAIGLLHDVGIDIAGGADLGMTQPG